MNYFLYLICYYLSSSLNELCYRYLAPPSSLLFLLFHHWKHYLDVFILTLSLFYLVFCPLTSFQRSLIFFFFFLYQQFSFHFFLHLSLSLISLFFILLYILYATYILGTTINFSIPSEDALLLLYKIIIGISAIVSLSCLLCALLYVLKWYIRGQSERSTGSYSIYYKKSNVEQEPVDRSD